MRFSRFYKISAKVSGEVRNLTRLAARFFRDHAPIIGGDERVNVIEAVVATLPLKSFGHLGAAITNNSMTLNLTPADAPCPKTLHKRFHAFQANRKIFISENIIWLAQKF